jgi:hypothetical protein
LKVKTIIPIATSVILAMMLTVTACTQAAAPTTPTSTQPPTTTTTPVVVPTPTPQVIYKDTVYNALNPAGDFAPVQTKTLAARLTTLDGQLIYVVQGEADPVIMPALIDRLKKDYPKTNWNFYSPSSGFGLTAPDATMKADAKATIRGVGW